MKEYERGYRDAVDDIAEPFRVRVEQDDARAAESPEIREVMDLVYREKDHVRAELTKLRDQYRHVDYWQPVWDALARLNREPPWDAASRKAARAARGAALDDVIDGEAIEEGDS